MCERKCKGTYKWNLRTPPLRFFFFKKKEEERKTERENEAGLINYLVEKKKKKTNVSRPQVEQSISVVRPRTNYVGKYFHNLPSPCFDNKLAFAPALDPRLLRPPNILGTCPRPRPSRGPFLFRPKDGQWQEAGRPGAPGAKNSNTPMQSLFLSPAAQGNVTSNDLTKEVYAWRTRKSVFPLFT